MAISQNSTQSPDRTNHAMLWAALIVFVVAVAAYFAYASSRNGNTMQGGAYTNGDTRGTGTAATGTTNP